MSDTIHSELLQELAEVYDLEALQEAELKNEQRSLDDGRQRLRKFVEKQQKHGSFANTLVARSMKSEALYDLINIVGAEFCWVVINSETTTAKHYKVLEHFANIWLAVHEKTGVVPTKDPTLLVSLNQWVFIALNKMLDAAATPRSNDFEIARSRFEKKRMDDEQKLKPRASIQDRKSVV